MMAVCRDLGSVCVDTAALEYDDGDFYDAVHNTPSGAAKLGRFLYRELAPVFPVEHLARTAPDRVRTSN